MTSLILLAALSCPPVKMWNATKFPWNDFDRQTLARVKKRCGEIYPDAPCLKLFRKYDERDYTAICGAKVITK